MEKIVCIILAAGKGTRMKSNIPKVAFNFMGKPLICHVIKIAKELNSSLISLVVGYKQEVVRKIVGKEENIHFTVQKHQLGTGDAVKQGLNVLSGFKGNILILYGDVPLIKKQTLQKLIKKHNKGGFACTLLTTKLPNPASYGRVVIDKNSNVERIVEAKDATKEEQKINEINSGIYCFDSFALFNNIGKIKNNNKQREFYLTDMVKIFKDIGLKVGRVCIKNSWEVEGINSIQELKILENKMQLDNNKKY